MFDTMRVPFIADGNKSARYASIAVTMAISIVIASINSTL